MRSGAKDNGVGDSTNESEFIKPSSLTENMDFSSGEYRHRLTPALTAGLGVAISLVAFKVVQTTNIHPGHPVWHEWFALGLGLTVTALVTLCLHFYLTRNSRADRKAEERLHKALHYTAGILNALPFGVFVVGHDRRVRSINQAGLALLGRRRHEIVGHHCKSHACLSGKEICPVLDEGKSVDQVECSLRHANGTEIPVLKSVVPLHLNGEEVLLESFFDLSRRKKMEEELRTSKEQTESLNEELRQQSLLARQMAMEAKIAAEAKDQFLTNLSHEIRTPLNGVMGMNQMLLNTSLDPDQRYYTETVQTCSNQLLKFFEDVLDYEKLQAGELKLHPTDFNLRALVEETAEALAIKAHEKNLAFSNYIDPAAPSLLHGDADRLRRILVNIIGNAVKFTESGEVAVAVTLGEETPSRATLRFSVRDTGIGIPSNMHEEIFELFRQVDGSMTRRHEGIGLGLTLAREFVHLMAGEIHVHSEEGHGAEFSFTLTLEKQPDATEFPAACPMLVGLDILVVEEDATSRHVLHRYLDSLGCRVRDAMTVREAKTLLDLASARARIPVVLISRSLPNNGDEILAQHIRRTPSLEKTAMILLTNQVQQGDAQRFPNLGYIGYLPKPIRYRQVQELLQTAVEYRNGKPLDVPTVESPSEIPASPLLPGASNRDAADRFSTRILLVEDNKTNQIILLEILKSLGFVARAANHGQEAIELLSREEYDLVLMDCQMPVMDGLEATRYIRHPDSPVLDHEIPVIAVTAHVRDGDREECFAAGMNDYLPKPIAPDALWVALARNLPLNSDPADRKESPRSTADRE
ncbi:MAG: response regulator [Phycisphaerae bacterium]|nr:response regulator [Phycisphaerae bacterium]